MSSEEKKDKADDKTESDSSLESPENITEPRESEANKEELEICPTLEQHLVTAATAATTTATSTTAAATAAATTAATSTTAATVATTATSTTAATTTAATSITAAATTTAEDTIATTSTSKKREAEDELTDAPSEKKTKTIYDVEIPDTTATTSTSKKREAEDELTDAPSEKKTKTIYDVEIPDEIQVTLRGPDGQPIELFKPRSFYYDSEESWDSSDEEKVKELEKTFGPIQPVKRGAAAMFGFGSLKPLVLEDYTNFFIHTMMHGKKESPYYPKCFRFSPNLQVDRIQFLVFKGDVPSYMSFKSQNVGFFASRKWSKTVFIGCISSLVRELASVIVITTNCSNILSIDSHKKSWEMAYAMLDMAPQRIADVFPLDKSLKVVNSPKNDFCSRTRLLMTPGQMMDHNIPCPIKNRDMSLSQWKYAEVSSDSPMFTFDAECIQDPIRATLISEELQEYDVFISGRNQLRCTEHFKSRFPLLRDTEKGNRMLNNIKPDVDTVTHEISDLLGSDGIFIAHQASSDLKAFKLMVPYVIDTSCIFTSPNNPSKPTPSLRELVQHHLGRPIQSGDTKQHDSKEDALGALDLVKLKLKHGVQFGNQRLLDTIVAAESIESGGSVEIFASGQTILKYIEEIEDLTKLKEGYNVHENISYNIQTSTDEVILTKLESPSNCKISIIESAVESSREKMSWVQMDHISKTIYDSLEKNTLLSIFIMNERFAEKPFCLMTYKN